MEQIADAKRPYIDHTLCDKVLTIGPAYKNHRGGIGALLSIYSIYYETFNFISTYSYHTRNYKKIFYYFKQLGFIFVTLLKNKKIQIVHIHGAHKGSFYRKYFVFIIAKYFFNKKIVYHNHSGCFDTFFKNSSGIQKKLIRHMINKSEILVCLSSYWKVFFEENFSIDRTYALNNVVPFVDKASYIAKREKKEIIQFLFLGRITNSKGVFDLLSVLKKNKSIFKNKMRLIIGGHDEIDRMNEFIETNSLNDLVEFAGWVDGEKKEQLFLNSNVYVLPSYYEGLPVSVLEAMSYGLPIISTRVGGIPEIVENQANGILVEPGNLDQIFLALLFFIQNPERIKEYGDNSYQKVTPFFPSNVFNELQNIYMELVD